MSSAVAPRRGVWAALLFAILATLFVVRSQPLFRQGFLERGDLALNALQVREAKQFREIYGNYSRFEFNHPGPAFFYVYAAGEWLWHDVLAVVPSPGNAHLVTGLVLQAAFLAAALTLLASLSASRAFLPLALLVVAIYFGKNREAFTSIWPPHAIIVPFFCFLVVGTAVALGRWSHVWLLVLTGGFLVHGHVAQPLFVGCLGGLALASGGWRWRQTGGGAGVFWQRHRRGLLTAGAIAAVFLLPILIDLATLGARSNVAAILARTAANARGHLGVVDGLAFFFTYPVATRAEDRLLTAMGPAAWEFLRAQAWWIALWLGVLALPGALMLAARGWWKEPQRQLVLTAAGLTWVAVALAVAWSMTQVDGIHHYNGFFFHGLFCFALMLVVMLVAWRLDRHWRGLAGLAVVALAWVIAGYALRGRPVKAEERGLSIRDGVTAALAQMPDRRPKLLVFDYSVWFGAAAVALEMERRGETFYTPRWWSFMFQPRHDRAQLEAGPASELAVWWIGKKAAGGVPITTELAIFPAPGLLGPDANLVFASGGNGFRYVVTGLETSERADGGTVNEPVVRLRFQPEPTARDVRIIPQAEAFSAETGAKPAEIFFNGQRVGGMADASDRAAAIIVPAALWNASPVAELEWRFPTAKMQRTRLRPRYEAWRSWRLREIRFLREP